MLTSEPTPDMINNWKKIYEDNKERLKPNRKSGSEVDSYFRNKYKPDSFDSEELREIVRENILQNQFNKDKLPQGKLPDIACYKVADGKVLVGIDLVTGFIQVESEDISEMEKIYDDLFVFRGLDEQDLTNYFLAAQYVECLKR